MVVEHTFVTTMDPAAAMRAASGFLASRGFVPVATASAFPLDARAPESLEMRRGRTNPARAKSVAELPQTVRIDHDRGRITVAISITPSGAWGGGNWTGVHIGGVAGKPHKMGLHNNLLLAVANGLERVLARSESNEAAVAQWDQVEVLIAQAARRRKRRWVITLMVIFGIFGLIFVIGFCSALFTASS